jgi:hypothetical protein
MLVFGWGPTRRAPRKAACIRASVSWSLYVSLFFSVVMNDLPR